MNHLKHFDARTVAEAVSLLGKRGARAIAGGTDLVGMLNNRLVAPAVLVNLKTIPGMADISEDGTILKIGALATITDLEKCEVIRGRYPLLAEAAHSVAAPQIRNMGTVGGNLCQEVRCWYLRRPPVTGLTFSCHRNGGKVCHAIGGDNRYHAIIGLGKCVAVCPSDLAPALAALNAKVRLAGAGGERVVPVEEFYTGLGNILKPGEIITEVLLPVPAPGTRQRFLKFRLRKAIDFAVVSVAAAVTIEEGLVREARIVLGGVAPVPYRARSAEAVIIGKAMSVSLAEAVGKAAVSEARPLKMNAYKVKIAEALVKRAIADGQQS